jgi:hypothetical protein
MKMISNRWLFLVILALIIQISANLSDYNLLFEDKQFLTEGILQVLATDLDNDRREEFVLAGKNDVGREFFLYWLTVNSENKPVVQWQSDNLFEEHSTIWITTGKFTAPQNQLLAISDSQYYLYKVENSHVDLINRDKHNLQLLNAAGGDVDGDGQTEIVVAKIGQITSKIYNGLVQIWKFNENRLELIAESNLIGNIRGMTVGDLDQDGLAEIFVDEGLKFAPGNMHILKYSGQKLTELFCLKKATKGPAYGMQIKDFSGKMRLVTATATGFINFFGWDQNVLVPVAKEISLGRDLMSLAVIDANNDQNPKLLVAGYPQEFLILAQDNEKD